MLAVLIDYNLFCVEPHAGRACLGAINSKKKKERLREARAPLVLELVCAPKRASHLQSSRFVR